MQVYIFNPEGLKQIRAKEGLSISQASKKAGISKGLWSTYEKNDDIEANYKTMEKIATAFNVLLAVLPKNHPVN